MMSDARRYAQRRAQARRDAEVERDAQIDAIPRTSPNYESAVEAIQERFEQRIRTRWDAIDKAFTRQANPTPTLF